MITLTTYAEARDALRKRELRQALYDEGHHLMDGVIVNLHGEAHLDRRRLENRLFRRDTFGWYERERIPEIIDVVLAPYLAAGHGDLLHIARRTMMLLSLDVAGVDRPAGTGDELDELYALMDRLARASTVAHATGDKSEVVADGDAALAEFAERFFAPSIERRRPLVEAWTAGTLDEAELPRDVLTTLLRNDDRLHLPPETVLREVAYFPWVGSHSTSNQLVHAMHHMFEWCSTAVAERDVLAADDARRQRFVHESLRLHPASPVARRIAIVDVELRSGRTIAAGDEVTIDLRQANRDPAAVGADPDAFDPDRRLAEGVAPWALTFGHGMHACLGQELAGGLEPDDSGDRRLLGSIAVMSGVLLRAGARPDPDRPATEDRSTTRAVWASYPVTFTVTSTSTVTSSSAPARGAQR